MISLTPCTRNHRKSGKNSRKDTYKIDYARTREIVFEISSDFNKFNHNVLSTRRIEAKLVYSEKEIFSIGCSGKLKSPNCSPEISNN